MIPKIFFTYSWVYDDHWRECSKLIHRKVKMYPSSKKILDYIKKVEKIWKKNEKKILQELSKISGLKWNEDYIYCYVVGNCLPFSDPLTIPIYKDTNDFIDMLVHELIHQLFIQMGNDQKSEKSWKYIYKKYSKESKSTKIHIPIHAIHSHIYLKFFNEKRLKEDIEFMQDHLDYKRSWDIVQKEGYQNIIKEFKKRLK